jgi:thioredoxin-dependent peroxiredoxin
MSTLKPGDKAPDFTAQNQDGKTVKLRDYKGKKVVLYFYPKDDTTGCTAEACNLRENYADLKARGYEVVGVSIDSVKSHDKFVKKYDLPFTLVADPEKKIVEDYGVWKEKSMYGRKYMGTARTTFLIDEKGKIEKIIDKVDTKNHAAQII